MTIGPPAWRATLDDHVEALAWSPDGTRLAAGSLAGDAVLFAAAGDVTAKLASHPMGVLTMAWSPDGSRLAAGGQDGVLRVTDGAGDEIAVHQAMGWVTSTGWSPDGGLVAAGIDRTLHLLDPDGAPVRCYQPAPSTITSLVWSPNSARVGVAAYGGLRWHDPTSDSDKPSRIHAWKGSLLSVAVHPAGRWACAGSQDNTVHLWRLWSGDDLSMSGYPAKIEHLAFRGDGRWMANACLGDITIWDFAKSPAGTAPAQGAAHDRHVTALAWQPGGDLLATGGADGRVVLWPSPRKRRQELAPLDVDDGDAAVARLAWSPDGAHLAVGRGDGTVELRDVAAP